MEIVCDPGLESRDAPHPMAFPLELGNQPLPVVLKFVNVKYATKQVKSTRCQYKASTDPRRKEILHGVTGFALPKELLALMGPSGSGKTTLLKLLSGRLKPNVPGSMITYNNVPFCTPLQRRIGFVSQHDILYPHLTVRETLAYAAMLKLPHHVPVHLKRQRAEALIIDFGLHRCRDTIVGDPHSKGISGGERRRVCVAHEVLTRPSLLFLDEPTSGLDSSTAMSLVEILQGVAKAGCTVITTIHQPSSRIFAMFDKLMVLADGSLVYTGNIHSCMDYFSEIGFMPVLEMHPPEFLLNLATGTVQDISMRPPLQETLQALPIITVHNTPNSLSVQMDVNDSGQQLIKNVLKYLVESYAIHIAPSEDLKLVEIKESTPEERKAISAKRQWHNPWWTQCSVLIVRGLKERKHDYISWLRLIQITLISFIAGSLWWHSESTTDTRLRDQVGLIYFITLFWGMFPLYTALFTFPQERKMLAKERSADMYRLSAYFMARCLVAITLDLVMPILSLSIIYLMTNLRKSVEAFFLTLLTTLLTVITTQGMGFALGAAFMDTRKASTTASITLLAFSLLGGYYIQEMPQYLRLFKYISYNFYSYRLLIRFQYKPEDRINCHPLEGCSTLGSSPVLKQFPSEGAWKDILPLLLMIVVYRLICYIFLRRQEVRLG